MQRPVVSDGWLGVTTLFFDTDPNLPSPLFGARGDHASNRQVGTGSDVTEKKPGQWLLKATATLEIDGQEKPAYVAESLSLYFV